MKSIDNLREWWRDRFPVMDRQLGCDFREHIDAIEFEAKALTDERDLLKRQWEAGVDFDQRLESCADNREDVTLFGVDYMPNPLDADGKPIHVGDVMENIVCPSVHREVTGVGVECFYGWDEGNGRYSQFGANCYRHHHAPTVEDVLREFVERLDEIGSEDDCVGEAEQECRACIRRDIAAAYAEFAAKLRLVGDE